MGSTEVKNLPNYLYLLGSVCFFAGTALNMWRGR